MLNRIPICETLKNTTQLFAISQAICGHLFDQEISVWDGTISPENLDVCGAANFATRSN